jgi:ribosomal protein L29
MTQFKDINRKDLMKTLHEKKDSLQAFRFGGAGSKSRNVKEGRSTRKDIARILTELTAQTKTLSSKASLEAKIEATAK